MGVSLLLVVGFEKEFSGANALIPINTGPAATTDHYFVSLQVANPSATIKSVIAEYVPAGEPIFVVGPANNRDFNLFHFLITTLTWPRQVGVIRCRAGESPQVAPLPDDAVGAALVWDTTTVNDSDGPDRAIGPHLRLVMGTEATEWPSLCSL